MDGINSALNSAQAIAGLYRLGVISPARGIDVMHGMPPAQDEIEAIVAVAPRACRTNAQWAVPQLLETARSGGITHHRRIAYLLATAQHTAGFGARLDETDAGDGGFDRYEPGTALGTALGNTEPGDGERFRGRGFVFIRGRANYVTWSRRLRLPDRVVDGNTVPYFVAQPQAMARLDIAAQTLVKGMRDGLFTGIALGYYINDKKTDYFNARRVIGGMEHAREVAAFALAYQAAIDELQIEHHRAYMQVATTRATSNGTRDLLQEVRDAVERLAARGEPMALPTRVVEWNGEARQGKFVQLDEHTCALHMGRGAYVRLDIQRDLNGIIPPEGKNMALKRSGEVRPASRNGGDFWR